MINIIKTLGFFFLASPAMAASMVLSTSTEFCLVNSTENPITISKIWAADNNDWTGDNGLPTKLINQTVSSFSAHCWPLTMATRLSSSYSFNIEIKTTEGALSWTVNQKDAVGEIYKLYAVLNNETNDYLMQKAGDGDGNATNVFIVEKNKDKQTEFLSNWMRNIPENFILKNVQLIGSHDAGVNNQDGLKCNVSSPIQSAAQEWGLTEQLQHGVRYFDIRLEEDNKQHYPSHKTWVFGCASKKSFENSLTDMLHFIQEHPSETIFLKLSHTTSSPESVITMLDTFNSTKAGAYFYKSKTDTYNWTDKTIKEVRGKIVLLLDCEFADFLNPEKGYFSFSTAANKSQCDADADTKIVFDKYSEVMDFHRMYEDQLNKLKEHGNDKNQLFLLSWTLTGGDIVAHVPRPAAYLGILAPQFGKGLPLPNIVYYDFEDPGINTVLISNYLQRL